MNDLTWIIVILDRSGSMGGIKDATEKGLNKFVEEQSVEPGVAKLTLVQFDDAYEVLYTLVPIQTVKDIQLVPRGSTAMLDAIGKTINKTKEEYNKLAEQARPAKVFVVITTDGYENASREFTYPQIQELLTKVRDEWKWQVIFTAANQDAVASANKMSISAKSALTYGSTPLGVANMYDSLSGQMSAQRGMCAGVYAHAVNKGEFFDDDDKDKQDVSSPKH